MGFSCRLLAVDEFALGAEFAAALGVVAADLFARSGVDGVARIASRTDSSVSCISAFCCCLGVGRARQRAIFLGALLEVGVSIEVEFGGGDNLDVVGVSIRKHLVEHVVEHVLVLIDHSHIMFII